MKAENISLREAISQEYCLIQRTKFCGRDKNLEMCTNYLKHIKN